MTIKTTLLLFRCRNVIEERRRNHQIIAEEMLLWGWCGTPEERKFLEHNQAKELLKRTRAATELSKEARENFLKNELTLFTAFKTAFTVEFDAVAEQQSKRLVEAHERFSALMDGLHYQVVYPVLPMDLLGIYILLPHQQ